MERQSEMSEVLKKFEKIEAVFLDVDGVLTDGSILVTEEGTQLRTMNIKDGYALQWAVKQGLRICIISGGRSEGVIKRLNGLGIVDVFTGIADKLSCFEQYLIDHRIDASSALYMGDDMPDLPVMKMCGLKTCPQDAAAEIKEIADYVSPFPGGKGCVRDVLEKVLKIQGKWHHENAHFW
jgi:3-deoxy-D-manno-octulosonate 8-phosphate phosphatase (KDO 8-P phosphatase)